MLQKILENAVLKNVMTGYELSGTSGENLKMICARNGLTLKDLLSELGFTEDELYLIFTDMIEQASSTYNWHYIYDSKANVDVDSIKALIIGKYPDAVFDQDDKRSNELLVESGGDTHDLLGMLDCIVSNI